MVEGKREGGSSSASPQGWCDPAVLCGGGEHLSPKEDEIDPEIIHPGAQKECKIWDKGELCDTFLGPGC